MKVVIIEDEKHARENLQRMLLEIEPQAEILASFDSVSTSVAWFKEHEAELVFMDIHLADDLSFSIFDQVSVKSPIIFTTAYDQYAIQAFKVNSIDYLLKPIDVEELKIALEKYKELKSPANDSLLEIKEAILNQQRNTYQQRFLVKKGEKISSVKVEDIAYFESEDRYVILVKNDGQRFFVDYKLQVLEGMLDPQLFFRLNRSFICHFNAIDNMHSLSKSRIKVNLEPANSREIIVSSDNTRLFKKWLNR